MYFPASDIVSTSLTNGHMTESTETLLAVLINRDESKMKIISSGSGVTLTSGDVLSFLECIFASCQASGMFSNSNGKYDVLLEAKNVNIYYITFQGRFSFSFSLLSHVISKQRSQTYYSCLKIIFCRKLDESSIKFLMILLHLLCTCWSYLG